MDNLAQLARMISSRIEYLESAKAVEDAAYPGMSNVDRLEAMSVLVGKSNALREVLSDIATLQSLKV